MNDITTTSTDVLLQIVRCALPVQIFGDTTLIVAKLCVSYVLLCACAQTTLALWGNTTSITQEGKQQDLAGEQSK